MSNPQIIVIGLSNKCQSNCSNCPHSIPTWKLQHGQDMLSIQSANIILQQLQQINFNGLISFSGKGQPLLNKNIFSILNIFKNYNTQLITNFKITDQLINNFISVNLKKLILSNSHINNQYNDIIIQSKLNKKKIFNNRGLTQLNVIQSNPGKHCYLPCMKLQIQPTGAFCDCPNSFQHYQKSYSIFNSSIKQFWYNIHKSFRFNAGKERSNIICKNCTCNGEITGKEAWENQFKYFSN